MKWIRSLGFAVLLASGASAVPQSGEQHAELFRTGTMTDGAARTWDVRFIPGTERIHDETREGWRAAADTLRTAATSEFWLHTLPGDAEEGWVFSRDVVVDHFAEGVLHDVRGARRQNAQLRSGDFGRGFIITLNGVKVAGKAMLRTGWLPIGAAGGGVYAVAAPVVRTAWIPVEASLHASGRGLVFPVAAHTWNTSAWLGTYWNGVPERETRWVREVRPHVILAIDEAKLARMVVGVASEVALQGEGGAETLALREIDRKIAALYAQRRIQEVALFEAQRAVSQQPEVRDKNGVLERARSAAEVVWTPEVTALMRDPGALHVWIEARLHEQGLEPEAALVDAIRVQLHADLAAIESGPGA